MNRTVRICITTDTNYITLTKICINSIIETKDKDTELIVYVLGDRVDLSSLEKFNRFDKVRVVILGFDMNKVIHEHVSIRHLTKAMYLRLMIPEIPLFRDIDKLLYLDADILAKKDLLEYYSTDIRSVAMGVIKDFGMANVWNKSPVDFDTYHYFYSGQLLMNLPYLRKMEFTEKCLQIYHNTNMLDQDIINQVVENQVLYMDPKYCFSWHKTILGYPEYSDISRWNKTYGTNYASIEQLIDVSVIWHFHGEKQAMRTNPILNRLYKDNYTKMKQALGE